MGGRRFVRANESPPADHARRWAVIGAPLDSAGAGAGEQRAPAALRAAGLPERLRAVDEGDISMRIDDSVRHAETGIVAFHWLRAASLELRDRLQRMLDGGASPLVLGGDCTVLLGVFAALRRRLERPGLCIIDRHADVWDADSSPTGAAADMGLALLSGHGPRGLVDLGGAVPMVDPARIFLLGHRPEEDADKAGELDRLPASVNRVEAQSIRVGPSARQVGADTAERLASETDGAWVHLDLDVLDEAVLPAVSEPEPLGLVWDDVGELLIELTLSEAVIGVSVSGFNADLDPRAEHTAAIVETLGESLARRTVPGPSRFAHV